jgi:hypothetical protein
MNHERLKAEPDENTIVAVAVGRTEQGNTHAAIIYQSSGLRNEYLHLAFHEMLNFEQFGQCYAYADIDVIRAKQVAGLCRLIRLKTPRIPYSLRLDLNARFCTLSGDLLSLGEAHGLNCATFIIVVFQSTGLTLIELEGWEIREDDRRWQRPLSLLFRRWQPPVSPLHIQNVLSEVGNWPIIRPEEVAGACLENDLPARFPQCRSNGEAVLNFIDGACGGLSL